MNDVDTMFDNYKFYFGDSAGVPISWKKTDIGELEIVTDLGTVTYDDVTKIVRNKIDTSTEDGWKKEFARRLSRKIFMKHITQQKLSEETGISQALLSMYTSGKRLPSVMNISKIAKVLGCSTGELVDF